MKKKITAFFLIAASVFMCGFPSACFAESALLHFDTVVYLPDLPEATREEVLKAVAESAKKEQEAGKLLTAPDIQYGSEENSSENGSSVRNIIIKDVIRQQ